MFAIYFVRCLQLVRYLCVEFSIHIHKICEFSQKLSFSKNITYKHRRIPARLCIGINLVLFKQFKNAADHRFALLLHILAHNNCSIFGTFSSGKFTGRNLSKEIQFNFWNMVSLSNGDSSIRHAQCPCLCWCTDEYYYWALHHI